MVFQNVDGFLSTFLARGAPGPLLGGRGLWRWWGKDPHSCRGSLKSWAPCDLLSSFVTGTSRAARALPLLVPRLQRMKLEGKELLKEALAMTDRPTSHSSAVGLLLGTGAFSTANPCVPLAVSKQQAPMN